MKTPQVGLDILVITGEKILLGLLTLKWGINGKQVYGVPGRDIKFGERIGQAVKRAIKEDLNCEVINYQVISVNSNYALGNHFVGIGVLTEISGDIKNQHPQDWEKWEWFDKDKIPGNLFPAAKNVIDCYLKNKVCTAE